LELRTYIAVLKGFIASCYVAKRYFAE
jgi:hypothetical protein